MPYYTFYYDTGFSDEEEMEEQVLRNTVNSEALMTAFSHHQPGTVDHEVESHQTASGWCSRGANPHLRRVFVSEGGEGEGAAVGRPLLRVRPRRPHVPHREDPKARRHGDTGGTARRAVDDAFW